ncbi:hypothetical protein ABCS02_28095 [Microbacterium sp. X-17]|uniref:hypothetical protein n=1 Tax=Microbacterium sp. X-17 TaxID=3144404 RepID=UPI0031F55AE1
MSRAFELPETVTLGSSHDQRNYWLHVLHGALLRKYVSPDDNLFLRRVIDAFERSVDGSNPEVRATWTELRKAFKSLRQGGGIEYVINNNVNITSQMLAFDDLYGTLLHGDFDRWIRSRHGSLINEIALFEWVLGTRNFVLAVRDFWRLAERDQLIRVTLQT